MSSQHIYLAVDLGASSGRILAGSFDGTRLSLEEACRFPNGSVRAGGHLYWDLLRLWSDIPSGATVLMVPSLVSVCWAALPVWLI